MKRHGAISKVVSALALLLIASGVIAYVALYSPSGQSSSTTTASTSATSWSTPKGTIVVGTLGQIGGSIDPAVAGSPLSTNLIRNLGAGLVDYSATSGRVVPALAKNWTSSDGGTVWSFTLRLGISFPDGSPFNATIEALSVNRSIDADSGSFAAHGYDHLIMNARALNAETVQFTLSHAADVSFAADTSLFPVEPSVAGGGNVINYTGDPHTENPNALGPYVLANWTKVGGSDHSVTLTPNRNYWNSSSGPGPHANVMLFFFSDKAALMNSFGSGHLDIAYVDPAYGGLQSSDVEPFTNNPQFKVWTGPSALGGSNAAVSTAEVGGVALDVTGIFRYYLLTKT